MAQCVICLELAHAEDHEHLWGATRMEMATLAPGQQRPLLSTMMEKCTWGATLAGRATWAPAQQRPCQFVMMDKCMWDDIQGQSPSRATLAE